MRLGEIYRKCRDNYNYINDIFNDILDAHEKCNEMLKSDHIEDTRIAYRLLNKRLKLFKEYIDKILGDIECFDISRERLTEAIINNDLTSMQKKDYAEKLMVQIDCIIKLCESMGLNKNNLGLDIKIPEVDDITEFKKYIDGLEFVFTKCPFFQSNEANLKFESVDIGSTWLIIGVACATVAAGSVLLNNIAAFVDKCFIIKSHRQTCLIQQQMIEKSKCDQKQKEELLKTIEKVYKISVDNEIKELEETTGYQIQDGDERGRVEQSFERLEKLFDKGMQIYTSIDSPPETKALFAPLEMHYSSIAEELKRIEKKPDDGDKE